MHIGPTGNHVNERGGRATHAALFCMPSAAIGRNPHFGPIFRVSTKMSRTSQIRTTHCLRVCRYLGLRLSPYSHGWVSVYPLTPWVGQLSLREDEGQKIEDACVKIGAN
jgi:hypothetical protein